MKRESGEFYARVMADLPRILFGQQRETGSLSEEMAEARPAETVRTNLAAGYQGLALRRFAAEVGFWFLNKIFR